MTKIQILKLIKGAVSDICASAFFFTLVGVKPLIALIEGFLMLLFKYGILFLLYLLRNY